MAWKRFRPSVLRTVCQSMYIGPLISLLTPAFIGLLYVIISYVPYYICGFFVGMLFLFRPYQLKGVKRKLILVAFVLSCVDTVYRVVLQVFGISNSQLSVFQKIPLNIISLSSICWQVYLLTNHFWKLSSRATLFIKLTTPYCFTFS